MRSKEINLSLSGIKKIESYIEMILLIICIYILFKETQYLF